jgi:hypothetical protein
MDTPACGGYGARSSSSMSASADLVSKPAAPKHRAVPLIKLIQDRAAYIRANLIAAVL